MIKIPQDIPSWFRHIELEKNYLKYDDLISHTLNKLSSNQCELMKKIENTPIGIFDLKYLKRIWSGDIVNSESECVTFNQMFKDCDNDISLLKEIDLSQIEKSSNISIYKRTGFFRKKLIIKNDASDQYSIHYIVSGFFDIIKDNCYKREEWNRLNQQRRYNQWHKYYISLYKKASAN